MSTNTGHQFYQANNGVWLIEVVPAAYFTLID
jgi:RNA:NAD 2'-phosphotransferase (TPT1/KptA family)